jgi:phage protein D/phage baseplate assembly protein gpV
VPVATAVQRVVEVDGAKLEADIEGQLESVLVVDRLAMPDTFTLVFRDPSRDVLGRAKLKVGAPVVISTTSVTSDSPEPLIDGEVTSIEADYDTLGTRAVVRGYDKSHRLTAGRKTKTYENVTYSDIAKQIAGDASLTPDVDDTGTTLEHVLQANQSDLDFLYGIARRIGYDCRVDGSDLIFKKPIESSTAPDSADRAGDDPVQLVWNHNLLEFRARMSAVSQVTKVNVRGWDVSKKEAVIGESPVSATNAEISMTAEELADKVGGGTMVVSDKPVATQEAADELAAARAEQVGSAAFEATALAIGSPALKAGVAVSIGGVDDALNGKWVVASSRHEFHGGTYRTALEFTGRQDRSLTGVISGGTLAPEPRIPGVAVAIVTDNDDPEGMGRVRVQFPWLAEDAVSWWARLVAPGAGKDYGVIWMPQVGDEVLVAFEQGDVSRPMVLGGLWNGEDTVPFSSSDLDAGSVKTAKFVSRKGHTITFLDADDEAGIELKTKGEKVTILLDDANGELKIKVDGKITIEATKDIEIKTDGAFKVKAQSELSLEASGQVKVKGATVALN